MTAGAVALVALTAAPPLSARANVPERAVATRALAPPPGAGWSLVFADEFDGRTLDRRRWTTCYWWEDGGCTNGGNAEQQWYVPENVTVADGRLRLTARKQATVTPHGRFDYSSGMVSTGRAQERIEAEVPRFAFQYGYAEMRAELPAGRGLWPAFWLLPVSHAWPPEIDVLEVLGHEPARLYHTVRVLDENGEIALKTASVRGPDTSRRQHLFAVDWRPDSITWYVDGRRTFRITDPALIPQEPMYLLINLAVGGTWPGAPDKDTPFPSTMLVDHVRVWSADVARER